MALITDTLATLHYVVAPHVHAVLFAMVAVVWGRVQLTGWNPLYAYLTRRAAARRAATVDTH